ncbi:type I secretion system permease/ATPase [Cognatiyoonia sp. IB215182]|uniref:type I secretion system permease/ATPase n=1 Tax=Cognatiyoonia sp. IB215182 TaxID=3097353 RepID=UPI002A17902A|nr:type I secretion system permease/ATPase [Cognatiyoonia sp. IB215182]MDX8355502.1 type I secretion system permease/ATPase [Cognatiyoonia sp. IB215182]
MVSQSSTQDGLVAECLQALRSTLAGIGLLSLPINLLMLTGPLFMLQVYDRVLASGSVPTLIVLAGLAGGMYVFYGLLEGIRSRVLLRVGQHLDAQLSATSYECSITLPVLMGRKAETLDPVRDLETVRQFLVGPGPTAIFDLPWMPVYLTIIYVFHPILGLVAIGGAVFICILIGLNELVSRKPSADANRHAVQRAAIVEQGRRNAEAVRAMGMTATLKEQWEAFNGTFLTKQRRAADMANLFSTLTKSFRFMLQSAMLGVGAWLAIGQEITPGVMIAASIMTSRALSPVEMAVSQWRGFVAARQGLKRLRDVVEGRPEDPERMELPLPSKTLALENVVSGPVGHPVLQNVGFTLEAGDGLGVIGPSGAGKSSLARTLVGVYPVLRGSLRLDGADLFQWAPDRQGAFIGYLPQDIQLFAGTVAQNISRFQTEAGAEDIIRAAELADAQALIKSLPNGYDTEIGPGGITLSGGQMQRIALARALYGTPFLVVLDEPNSNLDSEGETALTKAIAALREAGSIVIVIAHRPSALAGVDTVLFMKEGRAQAFGPKEEVLQQVLTQSPKPVRSA